MYLFPINKYQNEHSRYLQVYPNPVLNIMTSVAVKEDHRGDTFGAVDCFDIDLFNIEHNY